MARTSWSGYSEDLIELFNEYRDLNSRFEQAFEAYQLGGYQDVHNNVSGPDDPVPGSPWTKFEATLITNALNDLNNLVETGDSGNHKKAVILAAEFKGWVPPAP